MLAEADEGACAIDLQLLAVRRMDDGGRIRIDLPVAPGERGQAQPCRESVAEDRGAEILHMHKPAEPRDGFQMRTMPDSLEGLLKAASLGPGPDADGVHEFGLILQRGEEAVEFSLHTSARAAVKPADQGNNVGDAATEVPGISKMTRTQRIRMQVGDEPGQDRDNPSSSVAPRNLAISPKGTSFGAHGGEQRIALDRQLLPPVRIAGMILVYRYRVKSLNGLLNQQSRAVNYVWNFCNDTQKHALKWNKKWPTGFDVNVLTTGQQQQQGTRHPLRHGQCSV